MTTLEKDGNAGKRLTRESFTAAGAPVSEQDEIALCVQAWEEGDNYLGNEATYKLEWAACDTAYRSPRPYSTWEGSYILEPNLRRFDVAKWTNSIVSQIMQSLFSQDPPVAITPGPDMSTESATAWGVIIGRLLKEAGPRAAANSGRMPGLRHGFKEEWKRGTEQWALKGTFMGLVYVAEEEQCIQRRKSSAIKLPVGASGAAGKPARKLGAPEIETSYKTVKRLKFQFIDLGSEESVVWSPQAKGGDIRLSPWVVRRAMLDFYDLQDLALDPNYDIPGAKIPPGMLDEDDQIKRDERDQELVIGGSLIDLFFPPAETSNTQPAPAAHQPQSSLRGVLHQAAPEDSATYSNPLRKPLEVLEYLNQQDGTVIAVLDRKKRIRSGPAEFMYLSGNYWNLPDSILGIGTGQIGVNNQQLAQWIVNSALKVLALSLNAPHLAPDTIGQVPRVLRIGAAKVLTVTEQAFAQGGMKLMEMAKVDPTIWPVLQESTKEGESATGADALLVQGSSTGPRAGMGRTSGGASIMASKSDARLDGPMDNLVQQIFLPFISTIVWFVYKYMPDEEILQILGETLGQKFLDGDPTNPNIKAFDLEEFHNAKFDYDVLIGAKLGALRNLAQSLVLMFEYGMNPEMQQFLADVHGTTIDVQTIYELLLMASHCGTGVANQIIRKLTPEELQRNQKKQEMASQMGPQGKFAAIDKQGEVDQALQDKKDQARLMEKVIDKVSLAAAAPEAITGEPGGPGLGANE